MIPDEGNVVSVDVSSLEALSSQLKTLLGVADRHRDLAEPAEHSLTDAFVWTRLPQTRAFRAQTDATCGQAFEVVKALDELCARFQTATQQVARQFVEDDQFTADELRALGNRMGDQGDQGGEAVA